MSLAAHSQFRSTELSFLILSNSISNCYLATLIGIEYNFRADHQLFSKLIDTIYLSLACSYTQKAEANLNVKERQISVMSQPAWTAHWYLDPMNSYAWPSPLLSRPAGVPRSDGHCRPHPLRAQPAPRHRSHPGRVRVPGAGVQRPDLHLHLPPDEGAVEPGRRPAGSLLHRHCARLHLALGGRLFRQWRHRHLCPAVHLLPLGMFFFGAVVKLW